MIILHKIENDSKSDELEQKLTDLVLAFKTTHHRPGDGKYFRPYIEDGESIISGEKEIEEWILELEAELKWQRSLSGDGCFIDPESGKVC